jgi:PAS domain S-box-containing protein
MIALISFLGYRSIQQFSRASQAIMEDNILSIRYAEAMQRHFSQIHEFHVGNVFAEKKSGETNFKPNAPYQNALLQFEAQLLLAQKNITEEKEQELIHQLQKTYRRYLTVFRDAYNTSTQNRTMEENIKLAEIEFQPLQRKIREQINQLHDINMQAIAQKTGSTQENGNSVLFYLGLIGAITLIVNILLMIFLPSYLTKPLNDLNAGIQEIIGGNYDQELTVKFHQQDEVGKLANSFNELVDKLQNYDVPQLASLRQEKQRIETLIQLNDKATIILDEHQKILHINQPALELLGVTDEEVIGTPIFKWANENELASKMMNDWAGHINIHHTRGAHQVETFIVHQNGKEETFQKITAEIKCPAENEPELIGYAISLSKISD